MGGPPKKEAFNELSCDETLIHSLQGHLQGKSPTNALLTYLRANGKLRQVVVDTFRGLSNGLLAAETGKTQLRPTLLRTATNQTLM